MNVRIASLTLLCIRKPIALCIECCTNLCRYIKNSLLYLPMLVSRVVCSVTFMHCAAKF